MTALETREFEFKGYKIQITHSPPMWQAAIYPTKATLAEIDWTTEPIRANNSHAAEVLAQMRINQVLAT